MPILENMQVGIMPADGSYHIRVEPIAKRIRAFVDDVAIADSTRTLMMWESGRLCLYYFPIDDVRTDLLSASGTVVPSAHKGDATYYSVTVGERMIDDAAWRYLAPAAGTPEVAGYIAFHWKYMDHWFEEDEEVFVHARNPYHRIDVVPSSRRVEVIVDGKTVADTKNAMFLFETSLPPRYYIPRRTSGSSCCNRRSCRPDAPTRARPAPTGPPPVHTGHWRGATRRRGPRWRRSPAGLRSSTSGPTRSGSTASPSPSR